MDQHGKSLSQSLHDRLRQLIFDTDPGERLPSEPKLAQQMGVSRATLREAMRTFETQGIIHRKQGVGTFVIHPQQIIETGLEALESIHAIANRLGLVVQMGDYQVDHRLPTEEESQELDLKRDQKVVAVSWVMEAEGRPVAYLVDVLPDDVLPAREVHREFTGSILDLLLRRDDLALTTSRAEISAVAAEPEIARSLGIQRRDVLLYFESRLYDKGGRVIDYSYSYYLPGYFKFHVVRQIDQIGHRR